MGKSTCITLSSLMRVNNFDGKCFMVVLESTESLGSKSNESDLPEAPTFMETKFCKKCKAEVLIRVDERLCFLCRREKDSWTK